MNVLWLLLFGVALERWAYHAGRAAFWYEQWSAERTRRDEGKL